MSELDFQKIFASGASSQIDWTDDNYLKGWGYLGNVPPSYQSFDSLQRLNDLKFKYLYDEFMGIETNTEELISNHNENSEAHKTLFDKKLDKNGGTVTGNLNASGYNITATKFIGNLQGKADSATNADLATKATQDSQGQAINTTYVKGITASNATLTVTKGNGTTSTVTINNVGNSTKATQDSQGQAINTTYIKSITASNATLTLTKGNGTTSTVTVNNVSNASVANKLGTSMIGSSTKPIYLNNGTPTAINVDLSTLAPKASPAFTGSPTAPTPDTNVNNTQIATTAFSHALLKRVFGKTQPTLTALIDWEAVKLANGGTDVRSIKNTTYGVTAYGGDYTSLNSGDIILKQEFNNFDALYIEACDDGGGYTFSRLYPMWQFYNNIQNQSIFIVIDTSRGGWWQFRGMKEKNRPSTLTRFNVYEQKCGIVEIYGITY